MKLQKKIVNIAISLLIDVTANLLANFEDEGERTLGKIVPRGAGEITRRGG